MQNTVYISDVIDRPIDKVWSIMRGFNDMPSYHPGIQASLIEDGLPSDQVGCVRRLTLGEGFVRERLLCMDDLNYVFTLSLIHISRCHRAGSRHVRKSNMDFVSCW